MAQQHELLDELVSKKPEGASPVLHSDVGWQYQQAGWCNSLEKADVVQSMSRKGGCTDNGATGGAVSKTSRDLREYIIHRNTRRGQVKLKGPTPEEFREQSLCAA